MSLYPEAPVGLRTAAVYLALILVLARSENAAAADFAEWAQFRGPKASGVADGRNPPASWDVPKGINVKWKTAVPGLAHSSPIVWRDRVFVTTAVSTKPDPKLRVGLYGDIWSVQDDAKHSWRIHCLDRLTGKALWETTACEGVPKIKRHTKATHANSTPATDGKSLVTFFGSEGLYCHDLDGKERWTKDLGVLDSGYYVVPGAQWGSGSSPVIHEGRVIVQCDVQKGSFLAAFDLMEGRELWHTPRSDVPTWSTPAVHVSPARTQVIVNGYRHAGGYDLLTGKEIWKLSGGGDIPVPTPIVADDLIFLTSAHGPQAPIYCLRSSAAGDITLQGGATSSQHVVWSKPREGIYMQTPIVYGDLLYLCRDNGVLRCHEARMGNRLYEQRLGEGNTGFTASAVAADGRLYFTSEEGDVHVVRAGPRFEVLAMNPLGEICMATPAIAEGMLLFRTRGHVVCVAEGD